jgi:PleD family two-component response regulator
MVSKKTLSSSISNTVFIASVPAKRIGGSRPGIARATPREYRILAGRQTQSRKPDTDVGILLVDDDPGAIQLMGRILANEGELRFATNGSDALRLARESAPDLILLDAEMPGMSGFELLRMLKAESSLAEVPVIFITSHNEAGFEVSALDMGAADVIAKPLRSSRVLARVRSQLRVKHMADELRRTATTDGLTGVANGRQFEWLRANV